MRSSSRVSGAVDPARVRRDPVAPRWSPGGAGSAQQCTQAVQAAPAAGRRSHPQCRVMAGCGHTVTSPSVAHGALLRSRYPGRCSDRVSLADSEQTSAGRSVYRIVMAARRSGPFGLHAVGRSTIEHVWSGTVDPNGDHGQWSWVHVPGRPVGVPRKEVREPNRLANEFPEHNPGPRPSRPVSAHDRASPSVAVTVGPVPFRRRLHAATRSSCTVRRSAPVPAPARGPGRPARGRKRSWRASSSVARHRSR